MNIHYIAQNFDGKNFIGLVPKMYVFGGLGIFVRHAEGLKLGNR